jgi:hypothetical protein
VNTGPTSGGTTVTIRGTGFESCPICSPPIPPAVYFGGVFANTVGGESDTTLVVETPPHLPLTVDVTVEQWNGNARKQDAFTYTGPVTNAYERVLLPLFTPPVEGAFGSEFHTELRLANTISSDPAFVFGLAPVCRVSACLSPDFSDPLRLEARESTDSRQVELTGKPGWFLYIPVSDMEKVALNLRVFDVSRSAQNFGTEMPIVTQHEFSPRPITLLGVPTDPRFRNTLRIYSTEAQPVIVSFGNEEHEIMLTPGANVFEPAYATFSSFPAGTFPIDVTISLPPPVVTLPVVDSRRPFWAFVSVTNNETQLITTISPQR